MREVFDYALTQSYNMAKRELRTSPLNLAVHKYDMSLLRPSIQQYWGIQNAQPFFPSIEKLFKTDELENAGEYGVKLQECMTSSVGESLVRTSSGPKEVHKKVTMLLSPYKWMQGDYGVSLGLPTTTDQANAVFQKLQNTNNAGYVGAIVSIALSQSGCQHFPKVYGVFAGKAAKHKIDISDDYGELAETSWFSQNIGKLFDIQISEDVQDTPSFSHTRSARAALQIGDEITLDNVQELEAQQVDATMADMNKVFEDGEEKDSESDSSSVSTSYIFNVRSCECDEDDHDEVIDEEEECEPFAWATFENVPVQVTVMEKCSGTLYELLMMNPDSEKHLAWMTQVIFALAYAQRNFAFTHNDLHANNVMYIPTTQEYFYYNCGGVLFKVPTYGYLIKIIDFERCVAMVKLSGMKEPKLFMSDHFMVNEEAGGQYNYGDYYTQKHPEIKPNASFDLVRLATSLFWDLFPEGPSHSEYSENMLFKMFMKWLTLEDGKSVLFGQSEARHDRFHGFHLYKAIARYCKDAVPRKEVMTLKDVYGVSSAEGNPVLIIDF
jgi:serine/threonine protein kinase